MTPDCMLIGSTALRRDQALVAMRLTLKSCCSTRTPAMSIYPATFDREAACRPGSNEGKAPLGVLDAVKCVFDWEDDQPVRHEHDLIIYEMHVRGFTQRDNSGVAPRSVAPLPGVIEKIPYLKSLGDRSRADARLPVRSQEDNYWGYMPLNFFAPHDDYCIGRERLPASETNSARWSKPSTEAGIEVILDVVYNHTCEGDQRGPTYSFKGIDNRPTT